MNPLRVGLVGAGIWGSRYAAKVAATPGAVLAAVVDRDPDRARLAADAAIAMAPAAPAPLLLSEARELVGHVEAAVVAVPAHAHAAAARPLLEAGIAVLMEKPFASSLAEADELVNLAEARGALLQAAHLERFNPAVAAVRSLLRRPRFIEANRLGPFPGRGADVDVVLDLMIHDLDLVLDFVGGTVGRVSARGVAVISDEVDIANARLEFEDGCVANLSASRVSLKRERKMRLFQDNAYLSVDFAAPSLTVVRRDPPSEPGGYPQLSAEVVPVEKSDALLLQVASFVEAVRAGRAPVVSASAGRRALEVALLIGEDIRRWR